MNRHRELLAGNPDLLHLYDLLTANTKFVLGFKLWALSLNNFVKNIHEPAESFKPITALIFDIDGVLTDGSIWVYESGNRFEGWMAKMDMPCSGCEKIISCRYFRSQRWGCSNPFAKAGNYKYFSQRKDKSTGA
jgi:hypothetical protein